MGQCCGHHTALNMNQIILVVALFGSLVLSEEGVRKPKLFFVSTSATTSTLQTASFCYVTKVAPTTCLGRKRRAITSLNGVETEEAVEPSEFTKQDKVSSSLLEEARADDRKGRFLLYWITTTSISTSTSFTTTYSVSSVSCFPGTVNVCK